MMRSDLDHLPQSKQRELAHIRRVLIGAFEAAHAMGNLKWRKAARLFKIVLYGSYARGDWVDDPVGGYQSDYDILIVVNDERLTEFEYWSAAEDQLMRDATITGAVSAPVNFIVHSLADVNRQLEKGRPFFVDIVEQGIALYEAEGFPFVRPRDLPPEEARAEAQRYFDEWFPTATEFAAGAEFHRARGSGNISAFNYHQSVERFYHCVLLVFRLYSPKSHKLKFLRSHAEEVAPELAQAWPRGDKFSRRCFELLRQAYVNARYSPHYEISADELHWIGERVAELQALVQRVCAERISMSV